MPIRILDAATVGRIAAGEVVERPSSVVKELMENSIDAGATSITVEIRGGGIDYLRVTDNGCGIEPGQVRLAFENHATSKLQHADQLNDIRTLGFRGEALPSIASVSHVEMTTRARNQETGMKLTIDGGENLRVKEAGCPEGTTFIMKDLFFNLPVRRAFLKKPSYEGGLVSDAVARMILGNPGISVRYINNGSNVYHSFGDGKLRHAVFAVYGKQVAERMIEFDAAEGGTRIYGMIGVGELARSTRAHQMFFINGRSVRCPLLTKALEEVCRSRVTIGMYPMCALNIVIPPTAVDVNVHPNKLEVRFRDEIQMRMMAERLMSAAFEGERVLKFSGDGIIQKSVERVATVREIIAAPAADSQEKNASDMAEKSVIPVKKENTSSIETTKQSSAPAQSAPAAPVIPKASFEKIPQAASCEKAIENTDAKDKSKTKENKESSGLLENVDLRPTTDTDPVKKNKKGFLNWEQFKMFQEVAQREIEKLSSANPKQVRDGGEYELLPKVGSVYTDRIYTENDDKVIPASVETPADENLPYRVIGVLFKTYILVESGDSLLLIDQHAAHERLQYEKYMAQLEAGAASQQLLTPIILHLSAKEMALIQENMDVLNDAGYTVEPFGEMDIQVRAVPYILGKAELKPIFMDMINSLSSLKNATIDARRAQVMQMACKSAVKAGDSLSKSEIHALIQQMLDTGAPPTCPHGRPVMKSISLRELEKMFKRIQ